MSIIYSKSGILRIHLKTHTGKRRFSCLQCEYVTDYKNDFKEHMETVHETATPYECSMCDKKFKLARRLRQHQREHVGDDYPNACEFCERKFATPRTLRIHKEKKHGAPPPNLEGGHGIIAEFAVQ